MTTTISKHLDILGHRVTDRVSGYKGVVTSITFDLYGCVQGLVHPGITTDGKIGEQCWFDITRLSVDGSTPVMERPSFDWSPEAVSLGMKGPAEKPRSFKA